MFDTHSDYALNKLDADAIIFSSVSGEHIRLTREDFSSEEEFIRWKAWSDDDYHSTEVKAQNDVRCLPLDIQRDVPFTLTAFTVMAGIIFLKRYIPATGPGDFHQYSLQRIVGKIPHSPLSSVSSSLSSKSSASSSLP